VFGELVDLQAMCEHRGHDLSERMVPFVCARVREWGIAVGVGRGVVIAGRLRLFEVRILEAQIVVGDGHHQWVDVVQIEPAPRTQQARDLCRPLRDARQPTQRAEAHVHDVVRLPVYRVGSLQHVSLDEAGAIREAGARGQ